MWIDVKQTGASHRCETGIRKINVVIRRLRREWIGRAVGGKRSTQVVGRHRGICGEPVEEEEGIAEERRLTVELQVILALQDVVEDAGSPSNAHFPIALRIPGETEPGCEVGLIREIGAAGGSRISGEQDTGRRAGEHS